MICVDESSDSDYDLTQSVKKKIILLYYLKMKKKKKRRFWLRRHIQFRQVTGEFNTLFRELSDEDFPDFYRVTKKQFEDILSMISQKVSKVNTNYRRAITPVEKLAVCLR